MLTAVGLAFTAGYIFSWYEVPRYLQKLKKNRDNNEQPPK